MEREAEFCQQESLKSIEEAKQRYHKQSPVLTVTDDCDDEVHPNS